MNAITEKTEASIIAQPQAAAPLITVEQSRAVAEIQSSMVIARANPRDVVRAMDRIKNACMRPALAECAVYAYARGGSSITGPSIRLAEVLAQNWGNMQFGVRELSQEDGESTVQAFAWDVETNVKAEKTFQVAHVRHTKSRGSYKLEDPRDIYETVANQGSRRLRACILAIIPGDVVEMAVKQCDETLNTEAYTGPEAVKKLTDAFEKLGISKAQIEKSIQRDLQSILPAQLVKLRSIHGSLKDGMSNPSDWFEAEEGDKPKAGNEGVKAEMKKATKKATPDPTDDQITAEKAAILAAEEAEQLELKD